MKVEAWHECHGRLTFTERMSVQLVQYEARDVRTLAAAVVEREKFIEVINVVV